MGPILNQLLRSAGMFILKFVARNGAKKVGSQLAKQGTKQMTNVPREGAKQTTKRINQVGGKAVKKQSCGERFDTGNDKKFDLEKELKQDHDAKQMVENYRTIQVTGGLHRSIFNIPRL